MEPFNYPEALGLHTAISEMLLEQLDEKKIKNSVVEFCRKEMAAHKERYAEHVAQVKAL